MPIRIILVLLLLAVSACAAEPAGTVVSSFQPEATLPQSPLLVPVSPKPAPSLPSLSLVEKPAPLPLASTPAPVLSRDVLTNEGIVALADAGYSPAFLMDTIRLTARTHFDTTVAGLTYLRRNAIPEDLVEFMINPSSTAPLGKAPPPATSASLLLPAKTKFKKVTVRVPKIPAPAPVVFVAYASGSEAPSATRIAAPAPEGAHSRNLLWWRKH